MQELAGITVIYPSGDKTIYEILREKGIFLDAPCAGNGRCGKCLVCASGSLSEVTESEIKALSADELAAGMRLSCQARPTGRCEVRLSQRGKMDIEETATLGGFVLEPPLTFRDGMAYYYGRELGSADRPVGMAVDIGTTTVVAYFYDMVTGELLDTESGMNVQRAYGADVISRIDCCIKDEDALSGQHSAIVGQLNGFIEAFTSKNGISPWNILHAVVAGNPTMQHLFAGVSPNGIAVAPFTPSSLFGNDVSAGALGLDISEEAPVFIAPAVSGYVGGDITAGMASACLQKAEKPCLYIDIGTNGEMAIGCREFICCCSTAAGPAFEGAHIKYGMSSVKGAINRVALRGGEVVTETIGGGRAVGICGSGLIDAIAVMLRTGAIDETGRLCDSDEMEEPFASLVTDEGFRLSEGVYITAQDVREVQLAKAAVAAGISTLLHKKGLGTEDIDRVFVAGGFGAHIDRHSACEIGLLPPELEERIEFIGNAAGAGAICCLLSAEERAEIARIAERCEYIELSADDFFRDEYIEKMMFE